MVGTVRDGEVADSFGKVTKGTVVNMPVVNDDGSAVSRREKPRFVRGAIERNPAGRRHEVLFKA